MEEDYRQLSELQHFFFAAGSGLLYISNSNGPKI